METQPSAEKNKGNKMILIVGAIMLACLCLAVSVIAVLTIIGPSVRDVSREIPEGLGYTGIADEQLRNDVMDAITAFQAGQNNCQNVSLLSGEIRTAPDQTSDGSWVENWQVDACGVSYFYDVIFTPSPLGGTNFSVTEAKP
ncbi:MAG: hypothetical protein HYZ23_03585 [Chloroflexi bacterium]|nr:hypothetical protein [Chloroflexota bacterium]